MTMTAGADSRAELRSGWETIARNARAHGATATTWSELLTHENPEVTAMWRRELEKSGLKWDAPLPSTTEVTDA